MTRLRPLNSKEIERCDPLHAPFEQDRQGHRGPSVDTHVAVDEDGSSLLDDRAGDRDSSLPPIDIKLATVVTGGEVVVPDVGTCVSDKVLVAVFAAKVDDFGHALTLEPTGLRCSLVGVVREIATDGEVGGEPVDVGDEEVAGAVGWGSSSCRAPFGKIEGAPPLRLLHERAGPILTNFLQVSMVVSMNLSDLDASDLLELQQLAAKAALKAGAGADASDIAQDTIAKLDHQDLAQIANLEAWVQRVAKNAAIDHGRRAKHIEGPYDDDLGLEPKSFSAALVARQKIQDLVACPPEKYSGVLDLAYYEALTATEVGEQLGYSTATVHKMLSEARSMLRPNITAPLRDERCSAAGFGLQRVSPMFDC